MTSARRDGVVEPLVDARPIPGKPQRAGQARRAGDAFAVGSLGSQAPCAHHRPAQRRPQSRSAWHEVGGRRGCGPAFLQEDRGNGGGGLAARAFGLRHPPAAVRAPDIGLRHHGRTALRQAVQDLTKIFSHAAGAARPSRCSTTSSTGVTSPRSMSMSSRLTSCMISHRSPTASRGTMTRKLSIASRQVA